mmetsp:Transcript_14004/g.33196  ORF Transcript_14004/g.33196 Transcript_14004/m.33196 type:complete len:263 (-) Transcript_14004:430-1218(-)
MLPPLRVPSADEGSHRHPTSLEVRQMPAGRITFTRAASPHFHPKARSLWQLWGQALGWRPRRRSGWPRCSSPTEALPAVRRRGSCPCSALPLRYPSQVSKHPLSPAWPVPVRVLRAAPWHQPALAAHPLPRRPSTMPHGSSVGLTSGRRVRLKLSGKLLDAKSQGWKLQNKELTGKNRLNASRVPSPRRFVFSPRRRSLSFVLHGLLQRALVWSALSRRGDRRPKRLRGSASRGWVSASSRRKRRTICPSREPGCPCWVVKR